ncbi:MAG: hypothetical protein ABF876_14300 [Acetobacter aceti]|uniref:Uncharacterized protein n=1 Tax=Acetobacter aceti TaxID=435 RepID=A0A1U9KJR3_ACEAC|nr:hypothetical protein [Acetobacter aceti]AQS86055.1 hypothetical protein A0U92_16315 [Acetobacter aceti]
MKHEEFRESASFWTASGEWRCPDVGRRTIIAIQLELQLEPSWFKGLLYAVDQSVFDDTLHQAESDRTMCRKEMAGLCRLPTKTCQAGDMTNKPLLHCLNRSEAKTDQRGRNV